MRWSDQHWTPLSRCLSLLWLAALLLGASGRSLGQETGVLRGTVTDREFATPLGAATIWIVETKEKTVSDGTGHFALHGVPAGTYTVVFSKSGFDRVVRSNVVVAPGAMTSLEAALPAQYEEMEALVVRPLEVEGQAKDDDGLGQDLAQLGTKLAEDFAAKITVDAADLELLSFRAESAGVVDAVSKDFMSKAGAGSAAEAVKLVAGVTLADDRYAVIRGLSDRFVNTTVNGTIMPTADPNVRAVQLDLFPSALVDSIRVYKTFTPDLPGNTSGGSVDIVTPDAPAKLTLELKTGIAYNTLATGNKNFLTSGQGMGYFGLDQGDRKQTIENGQLASAPSPSTPYDPADPNWQQASQHDAQLRSLSPVMGPSREAPPPNHGWGLTYGDRLKLDADTSLGWLTSAAYSSKYTYKKGIDRDLSSGSGDGGGVAKDRMQTFGLATGSNESDSDVYPDDWRFEEGKHTVAWGLGSVLHFRHEDHSVKLNYLRTQQTEDTASTYWDDQTRRADGIYWRNESLVYTDRSMESLQLVGKTPLEFLDMPPLLHGLDPGTPYIEWAVAQSEAIQDQPDSRSFLSQYETRSGWWRNPWPYDNAFALRSWRTITEETMYYRADLVWPYKLGEQREGRLKGGWSFEDTSRGFTQDTFTYTREGGTPYWNYPSSFSDSWSRVFLEPQRLGYAYPIGTGANFSNAPGEVNWHLRQYTYDVDYDGVQQVPAYYGMAEVPVMPWLKLVGGERIEQTTLTTEMHAANGDDDGVTVLNVREYLRLRSEARPTDGVSVPLSRASDPESPDTLSELADASIEETDTLPSLGLIIDLYPHVSLRGTWSRTLARPTFKELSPVMQQERFGGQGFAGNPTLAVSHLENYDLRLEWNPGDGRLLSVSGFYKEIEDPIEYAVVVTGWQSLCTMPFNYPRGEVTGFELEARQDLGRFLPWLKGLSVGANYTWLEATVTLPEDDATMLESKIEQHRGTAESIDTSERRMKDQPDSLVNVYLLYDLARTGTSFGLFLNHTGETLLAGHDWTAKEYTPNRVKKPFTSLDFNVSQKVFTHGKLSLSITNLLDPVVEEVWQSDYVDQGEAIASSYTKGRTISLSFSLKW